MLREGVRLDRRDTAPLAVDVQERVFGAMEPERARRWSAT